MYRPTGIQKPDKLQFTDELPIEWLPTEMYTKAAKMLLLHNNGAKSKPQYHIVSPNEYLVLTEAGRKKYKKVDSQLVTRCGWGRTRTPEGRRQAHISPRAHLTSPCRFELCSAGRRPRSAAAAPARSRTPRGTREIRNEDQDQVRRVQRQVRRGSRWWAYHAQMYRMRIIIIIMQRDSWAETTSVDRGIPASQNFEGEEDV